ncbi:CsbD family protein [Ketogulonicigenium robustum]|uniref:CsbD family protein n=1 Tax=Ketogulonicigenium robustum TaxID=92947 RepID=A0A1W6P0V5_9RHOB|nr:CsbD family protein [Ketogulonicigenium robustum]ARO15146.1 CsbD family protein [Ketogulonicigenium robustum]
MNWDIVKGKWAQLTGDVKAKWGELTDDDLTQINGEREKLAGKIQERYGIAKDEAEKQIDAYLKDK